MSAKLAEGMGHRVRLKEGKKIGMMEYWNVGVF
jgi:hypothetical protein